MAAVNTPIFPSRCPYIVSVGATQLKSSYNLKSDSGNTGVEEAAATKIYSGGGFSNVFGVPDYQVSTFIKYINAYSPPYGLDRYKTCKASRCHPNISANGVRYAAVVNDMTKLLYATSAATSTLAAIFTIINQARMNVGKSSIGFVNPVLYQNPELLYDITEDGNPGCGTAGFSAEIG